MRTTNINKSGDSITKPYDRILGMPLGKDVIMTPGLKRRMDKVDKAKKRMDTFYMGAGESLDTMRGKVQAALRERYEKSVKGKKDNKGMEMSCPGGYGWVSDLAPGKAIYEIEGKKYGCSWKADGRGGVDLGPPVEVEEKKEYREVGAA